MSDWEKPHPVSPKTEETRAGHPAVMLRAKGQVLRHLQNLWENKFLRAGLNAWNPVVPAQEMPGLLVEAIFRVFQPRAKKQADLSGDLLGGNDVPDAFWNQIHRDEVKGIVHVGPLLTTAHLAAVAAGYPVHGGLNLDPHTPRIMFHDKVITGRITPRFADLQPKFRGACHKAQLRPFTTHFVVLDFHPVIFHMNFRVGIGPQIKNAARKGRAFFSELV